MTIFKRIICLTFLCSHCVLIIIANLSEIKGLGQDEETIQQFSLVGQKMIINTKGYLPNNPKALITKIYTHFAGINTGYCFFSPNVPTPSKVVFELSNTNNNTLTQAPILHTKEGQLRFTVNTSLFKSLKEIRELLAFSWAIRMLEYNPDYNQISVIVGANTLPAIAKYDRAVPLPFTETERYEFELNGE